VSTSVRSPLVLQTSLTVPEVPSCAEVETGAAGSPRSFCVSGFGGASGAEISRPPEVPTALAAGRRSPTPSNTFSTPGLLAET
jgi:hypothetical protein